MTLRERKDLESVQQDERILRQLIKEVYPDKEFTNGMFSPLTGEWLKRQILSDKPLVQIMEKSKEDIIRKAAADITKKREIYNRWKECYRIQNS